MQDSNILIIALGVLAFLAGTFFKGRIDKAHAAKKTVKDAEKREAQGVEHATVEHAARQEVLAKEREEAAKQARDGAAANVLAGRTDSGDRVDDLADRLRRLAARRKRERAAGQRARTK